MHFIVCKESYQRCIQLQIPDKFNGKVFKFWHFRTRLTQRNDLLKLFAKKSEIKLQL